MYSRRRFRKKVRVPLPSPSGASAQLSATLHGVRKRWKVFTLSTLAFGACAPAGSEPAAGSWLDAAQFESWNRPGMPIPSAPQGEKNANPRCRELVREPASEVEQQVHAHGWDLVGPTAEGHEVLVIVGAADYDGMCRPRQYQEFVFVRGSFAGTLSPHPMDSRTDGALGRVTIPSDRRLEAQYARYAAADPLCCPSRTPRVVFAIGREPPLLRPVSASTVSTRSTGGQ